MASDRTRCCSSRSHGSSCAAKGLPGQLLPTCLETGAPPLLDWAISPAADLWQLWRAQSECLPPRAQAPQKVPRVSTLRRGRGAMGLLPHLALSKCCRSESWAPLRARPPERKEQTSLEPTVTTPLSGWGVFARVGATAREPGLGERDQYSKPAGQEAQRAWAQPGGVCCSR